MDSEDDHDQDWASYPSPVIRGIPQRDWSCLPPLAVNIISHQLNAIDHVHFRSVCMEWRGHTKERKKDPLLILADFNQEDGTIKGLSLFDIIRKEVIVCLHRATFLPIRHDYYLGASHGWIFTGQIMLHEECDYPYESHRVLRIHLINPITSNLIILPLLGPETKPGGRVFLLGRPDDFEVHLTVIYYAPKEKGADVHFIRYEQGWPDRQWTTFSLEVTPSDVVAVKEQFYVSYEAMFYEVILETGGLDWDRRFILRGSDTYSSIRPDLEFFLRYFQGIQGDLYFAFDRVSVKLVSSVERSYEEKRSYRFSKVNFKEHKIQDRFVCCLESFADVCFFTPPSVDREYSQNITPSGMVLKYSKFWGDGMQKWKPVGWITPVLINLR